MGDGSEDFLTLSSDDASFLYRDDGFAGVIDGVVEFSQSSEDFSFGSGQIAGELRINTTSQSQSFELSDGDEVDLPSGPYVRAEVELSGVRIMENTLNGNFSFEQVERERAELDEVVDRLDEQAVTSQLVKIGMSGVSLFLGTGERTEAMMRVLSLSMVLGPW